jgi:hypothetical protein
MQRCYLPVAVITLMTLGLAGLAQTQQILIWDHDKGADNMFYDPEGSGYVGCEYGIQRALSQNGVAATTLLYLPTDLSPYDAIFIVMGWYC